MKYIILTLILILNLSWAEGKKLISKTGHIMFYSHTPVEDIEAHNRQAVGILDTEEGTLEFMLLIRSFEFEKKLMQEHFNENYMESDKFPKSTFKGAIINPDQIDFNTPGTYKADVSGDLSIHGVERKVTVSGKFMVQNDGINTEAKFIVKPADFGIAIPDVVKNKIAKEIEVTVKVNFTDQ